VAIKHKALPTAKKVPTAKTPAKRSYSFKTLKVLFGLSGNKCAVPGCNNPIIKAGTDLSGELVVGQICHIYAASDDGPRGKLGLTAAQKNAPSNLILCCPTHHVIVDGQHTDYPASELLQWKRTQERAYRTRLSFSINSIGYSELEVTAKALMSHQAPSASDTTIISPKDKIKKNGLSASVEFLLNLGAAKSREVETVLLKAAQLVVFCFDLAVATVWAKLKKGFGTLIHDSSLFADVDPRQVASALSLANQKSMEFGFQYICCLNSGLLESKDFNFEVDPLVRIRLTDDSPKGRLLGIRLRPREQEDFQS
jgi:Uncharacterised protein conserved in bacteria (DUF2326)